MEISASQLAEIAIESDGTSVLFIATEKKGSDILSMCQCQGSTQGIITGLVNFAKDPKTDSIFNEVLTKLNQ